MKAPEACVQRSKNVDSERKANDLLQAMKEIAQRPTRGAIENQTVSVRFHGTNGYGPRRSLSAIGTLAVLTDSIRHAMSAMRRFSILDPMPPTGQKQNYNWTRLETTGPASVARVLDNQLVFTD